MNRIEHVKRHQPTLRLTLLITVACILLGQSTTAMGQNIFPGSGNVGVGTTSPAVPLHVSNSSTAQARIETTGTAAADIEFKNPSRRWAIGTGLMTAGGDFSIYDANAAATRMFFDTNGNAGIGTTAPTSPLQIVGNEPSTDYATLRVKPSVTHGGIVIDSANDSTQAHLRFFKNGVPKWQIRVPFYESEDLRIWSWATSSDVMSITTGGNVGIGTTTPNAPLQIKAQNIPYRGQLSLEATDHAQITFYSGPTTQTNLKGHIYYQMADNQFVLNNFAGGPLIFNPTGGNVGIGTSAPAPTAKLDVNGNVNVTGNITATGNIAAKYQDVAEWVEAAHALPAGTVVSLNPQKSNQVMASLQAYDTRVAGVVSAQPGIALGESGVDKVLVATTGRVKVKVDATGAPIHIGDLLVTSDKEGLAMKSEPMLIGRRQIHAPGTLIGKALEPLEKGTGEILVLLSLQ